MKRLALGVLAASLLIAAAALSDNVGGLKLGGGLQVKQEGRNPWTHLRLNNDPGDFQFAIVSDRTGGHRAQGLLPRRRAAQPAAAGVRRLRRRPDRGLHAEKADVLAAEWKEFDGYVNQLKMPFFYVPGNHDVANPIEDEACGRSASAGATTTSSTATCCSCCLNTDDPPKAAAASATSRSRTSRRRWPTTRTCAGRSCCSTSRSGPAPTWRRTAGWRSRSCWRERPYTVFCGHVHRYRKFVRQGRNYYQLATTGGGSKMRGVRYGEFDHIVWVTMKKDGPVLANMLLDGVLPDDLKPIDSDEEGVEARRRATTVPVRGRVAVNGRAEANVLIVFYRKNTEATGPALVRVADGLTDENGNYSLSTYTANDGVPMGEYLVSMLCACRC